MISTKILLYKHKTLTNGTHPVVMQVIHKSKKKVISTGFYATSKEWNENKGQYKRTVENATTKNMAIRRLELLAQKIVDEAILSGKPFSLEEFKRKFSGKQSTDLDFVQFVEELVEEMKMAGKIGNLLVYNNVKNSLQTYVGGSLRFSDINVSFLCKYEAWLAKAKHDRPGCSSVTIHTYIRTIRAVFNKAISRELINGELYPFRNQFNPKGYSLAHLKLGTNPRALSPDEIEKFKNFDIEKYPEFANSYHYFMFMYYCRGINWTDLCKLKHSDIKAGRVYYKRQKTGKTFSVKLSSHLLRIISHFDHKPYIFPILTSFHKSPTQQKNRIKKGLRKTNRELKEIAVRLGIDPDKVTTYTARHSYAMTLKRAGFNTDLISDGLGHADPSVTKHYLSRFEDNVLDEADKVL